MGRRERRKVTRSLKEQAAKDGRQTAEHSYPQLIATGRISGGVSVTYVPFQSMPGADEIATTAVRKVIRALRAG